MVSSSEAAENFQRLLIITAVLPYAKPDNGGRYVQRVVEAAANHHEFSSLAPDGPVSHRAGTAGGRHRHKLLEGLSAGQSRRWDQVLIRMLSIVAPQLPPRRFLAGLLGDPKAHGAVRAADVINLQCEEYGVLIPFQRRLNRTARIVCTFHDVLSQRYSRASEAAGSFAPRVWWAWAAAVTRRSKCKIMRGPDYSVVLSQKDADLLPIGKAEWHVVTPPLAVGLGEIVRSAPTPGDVLFAGFLARWKSEEGLQWFLSEVWPLIKAAAPTACLRVAGLGIRSTIFEAARVTGVELLAFVPDLEPAHEWAFGVVVPVRPDADVKPNVVDALVAGMPVMSTTLGAEGTGDRSRFAGMHNDADEFGSGVLCTLKELAGPGCQSANLSGRTFAPTIGCTSRVTYSPSMVLPSCKTQPRRRKVPTDA